MLEDQEPCPRNHVVLLGWVDHLWTTEVAMMVVLEVKVISEMIVDGTGEIVETAGRDREKMYRHQHRLT
jgi:hypothetical protein